MRSRNAVCIFCRHDAISKLPLRTSQRWRSTAEPFVLPRVVIDLDAADNANVMQFEELSREEKAAHLHAYDDQKWKQFIPAANKRRKPDSGKTPWRLKVHDEVATPSDLLSYALKYASNDHSSKKGSQAVSDDMSSRYRPQDPGEVKLRDIVNAFHADGQVRLKRAGFRFTEEQKASLQKTIKECDNLYGLHKIVSNFTATKESCQLLCDNGFNIAECIRRCRKTQPRHDNGTSSAQVLQLLNNLHLNMQSKGVDFDKMLASRALYYAAKVGSLPAVSLYFFKYVVHMEDTGRFVDRLPIEVLDSFLEHDSVEDQPEVKREQRRRNTLRLLTGWDTGIPSPNEEQKESIGKYLIDSKRCNTNVELYRRYLFTLAHLNLKELLMAEWTRCEESFHQRASIPGSSSVPRTHQYFALLFSYMSDDATALSILKSYPIPNSSNSEPLDARLANSNYIFARHYHGFIFSMYKCLKLKAPRTFYTSCGFSVLDLPMNDPEKTLAIMKDYMITDFPRGVLLRKVGVRDVDGTRALVILPLKEGGPLWAREMLPVRMVEGDEVKKREMEKRIMGLY